MAESPKRGEYAQEIVECYGVEMHKMPPDHRRARFRPDRPGRQCSGGAGKGSAT